MLFTLLKKESTAFRMTFGSILLTILLIVAKLVGVLKNFSICTQDQKSHGPKG